MLMQFQKGDIVRHLGLLDLQRTMQRALRRSNLPVAYSKGFNPHMVMSFASAGSPSTGARQLMARANILAVVVLPVPRVPQKR